MNNPNCTFTNTVEEISELFDKTPITIVNDKFDYPTKDDKVIGFVDEITRIKGDLIYGDICVFGDDVDITGMVNYVVNGNIVNRDELGELYEVTSVGYIVVKEVEDEE
jgi:hypothetical protein